MAGKSARASTARSSSMPTISARPEPTTTATKSNARFRSSKATPCSMPSRSTACPSISTRPPPLPAPARIDGAEQFARNTGIAIRHGDNRAFYAVDADHVQLPPFESFTYAERLLRDLAARARSCDFDTPPASPANLAASAGKPAPGGPPSPGRRRLCRRGGDHARCRATASSLTWRHGSPC